MSRCLYVFGSTNTDMVVKSVRIPRPGETILGGEFLMTAGGKGANQAVAAARLGGMVRFVTRVGDDVFGREAVVQLKAEGIDTQFIGIDPALPSGVALITVDALGENSIVVASGANGNLLPEFVAEATNQLGAGDIVLVQLEIPLKTVEAITLAAHDKAATVVLNPAPAQMLPKELLASIDWLIPNQTEAQLLTGIEVTDQSSASLAALRLIDNGVKNVVITLGEAGAWVASVGKGFLVPARKVTPIDTTAAGDVFCGAFAVALAEGQTLDQSVAFASHAASISVTRLGAQTSIPYRHELNNHD